MVTAIAVYLLEQRRNNQLCLSGSEVTSNSPLLGTLSAKILSKNLFELAKVTDHIFCQDGCEHSDGSIPLFYRI